MSGPQFSAAEAAPMIDRHGDPWPDRDRRLDRRCGRRQRRHCLGSAPESVVGWRHGDHALDDRRRRRRPPARRGPVRAADRHAARPAGTRWRQRSPVPHKIAAPWTASTPPPSRRPTRRRSPRCARTPPAVHRYPGSMAGRIQGVAPSGRAVRRRRRAAVDRRRTGRPQVLSGSRRCPASGTRRRAIFLALLGKQRGVQPRGLARGRRRVRRGRARGGPSPTSPTPRR